jgi:hypothetical protein
MITTSEQVPGVSNLDAPAATTIGGNYVLAWQTGDSSILWMQFPATNEQNTTQYDFGKQQSIADVASSGGPALATFKNKAWMTWKGEGSDSRIYISSLSGATWSLGTPVPAIGTQSSPALTATSSELFLAWMGEHDNTIYWAKSSDGTTWAAQQPVPGALSSDTPALAAFGDTVYLAWKGASDARIWLTKYSSGKGWGTATALSNFGTSNGPALGIGSTGNLHLVWKGESDDNVWESFRASNGTAWTPQAKISLVATNARPALATQTPASDANQVLLAWKGASDDTLWVGPLDDLRTVLPAPPPPPNPTTLSWSAPVTGFGSGALEANFSCTLTLTSDGGVTFSGQYTDSGHIPVFSAPSQNYTVVVAVVGSNKVPYTFSHSGGPVPTGGAQDKWNITQISMAIQQNWAALQGARVWITCSNSVDAGSLLDDLLQDVVQVIGWIATAVEVLS